MTTPPTPSANATPAVPSLEQRMRDRRDDIRRIAARYGVDDIRVFGSVARGQSSPDSDIDVLINPPERFSLLDQVGLKQDLEDLLGRPVDVVTVESLHWYIRDRVLQEAVPV